MKIFYFHGHNPKTKGRISSKIWKIECTGRTLRWWFGSVDLISRKPQIKGTLRSETRTFRTEEAARADKARRIREQLDQKYFRKPRAKAKGSSQVQKTSQR